MFALAAAAESGDQVKDCVKCGFERFGIALDLCEEQAALQGGKECEREGVGIGVGRSRPRACISRRPFWMVVSQRLNPSETWALASGSVSDSSLPSDPTGQPPRS